MRDFLFIVLLQTYICCARIDYASFFISLYINKMTLKPEATVQKSEIKIFNWVTLSTKPKYMDVI